MNKSRVLLLFLAIATLVILANTRITSARWLVDAGWSHYEERICRNGIVYNITSYSPYTPIDWDRDPGGNEWLYRSAQVCDDRAICNYWADGNRQDLNIISATSGPDETEPQLGSNFRANFWTLKWSDELVPGEYVRIVLANREIIPPNVPAFEDWGAYGFVEDCFIEDNFESPSYYTFCDQSPILNSEGNYQLNLPSMNILDMDLSLAITNTLNLPVSANLSSSYSSSINLFNNLETGNGVGGGCRDDIIDDGDYYYFDLFVLSDEASESYVNYLDDPFYYDPYSPLTAFSNIEGLATAGSWDLNFTNIHDNATLDCWCMNILGAPANTVFLPFILSNNVNNIPPTTNNPPNTPTQPFVEEIGFGEDYKISLNWFGSDLDGDSVTYDVYMEPNDSTPDILVCGGLSKAQCDLNLASGEYYWQVVATDSHGVKTSGPVWEFIKTIENPGFEKGEAGWETYSSIGNKLIYYENFLPIPPRSGSWAAQLGGVDGDSYIEQQVYVAPNAPFLVFWHYISSEEDCDSFNDNFYFSVNWDIWYGFELCEANSNSWVQNVVDLSVYNGQTIDFQIYVVTDCCLPSNFYVDDFSFEPSAPTQNADLITIAPVQQPAAMQKRP